MLGGSSIALKAYIKKKSKINNLSIHLRKLEKIRADKIQVSRKKSLKVKQKSVKLEIINQQEKMYETKSWAH